MAIKNKVFIFLPDGVGLRTFAYSNFYSIGLKNNFEITYWNNTPFDLSELGFNEIKVEHSKLHPHTEFYKNARTQIELNLNIRKNNDKVFDTYRFPFSYSNWKTAVKSIIIKSISIAHSSNFGLNKVREKIKQKERKTLYYYKCLQKLQKEQPSIVFCTNQRHAIAIAPLLAAQELNIPTATFIFSWDNLPKATMVVETDYYFVWSAHMKKELQDYHPYINENQILITGSPQFENHFQEGNRTDREIFFKKNGLDIDKKYICYSGDDETTSPYDPIYLLDLINAVRDLNKKGKQLGVIFRRCPVDFSKRFDFVLENNKDIVVPIEPLWNKIGEQWNCIMPTKEDSILQLNIVIHTELVVNLGSSMVFDYASHKKLCAYMNYNPVEKENNWSVEKIYKFIHFRSMPENAVVWLNNPSEIAEKIENMLGFQANEVVSNAQEWFEKINQHPAEDASRRIWEGIAEICKK